MKLLARLVASDRCELFVNMIINEVQRFAGKNQIDQHLTDLYGTDECHDAPPGGSGGRERMTFLHNLYERQVKDVAGLQYVQSFEMVNKGGLTSYYLFYGTRHIKGLKLMKAAMWRADPGGGFRFSDRLAGQEVFFTEGDIDAGPLRAALLQAFAGHTVAVTSLEDWVLAETPYRETHLRKFALAPMVKSGEIVDVIRPAGKNSQYPPGTRVTFR